MLGEFKKHKLAYLILILGLTTGVFLFLGSWPDRTLQRIIAVGIATFYILWGVLTHLHANRITKKVIGEYLGVGFLAGLLLVLITF